MESFPSSNVPNSGVPSSFSADELAAFDRQGFIVVPGLADATTVERMIQVTRAGLDRGDGPIELEADLRYPGAPQSRDQTGGTTIRRLKEAQGRTTTTKLRHVDATRCYCPLSALCSPRPVELSSVFDHCVCPGCPRPPMFLNGSTDQ